MTSAKRADAISVLPTIAGAGGPALKERLLSQGAIPGGSSSADFASFIAAESKKWAQVVKIAGAKVD